KRKGQGVQTSHHFASSGVYPVTLTVDDNTGLGNSSKQSQLSVHINGPPEAVIRTDGALFCVGEHILFDGSSSQDPENGPLRYLWNLGEGEEVEDATPVHIYDKPGDYSISLRVFDDSGLACNSAQAKKNIHLLAAPVAQAGADLEVCTNTNVAFDGTASRGGNRPIIGYEWNFGDGNNAVGAKASHVYTEPGVYAARLSIQTPDLGACDNRSEDECKVQVFAAPRADFKAEQGCVGEAVDFDATESAALNDDNAEYSWAFGDTTTATGVSTQHVYTRAGHYEASLKVSSKKNTLCNTSENSKKIKINQPPVARIRSSRAGQELNFETPQVVLPNALLHFSAEESNDNDGVIKKINWDFGDGQQAEGWFTAHSFQQPGAYTVRLTIEDDTALACNTAQATMDILVVEQSVLGITGPDRVCVQQAVHYELTGEAQEVRWDLGLKHIMNGTKIATSFKQSGSQVIHTLVDGQAGPTMKVEVLSLPEVELPDRISVFVGEELSLTPLPRNTTGGQSEFRWDTGDGKNIEGKIFKHVYSQPGTYTVHLTMSGAVLPCLVAAQEVVVTVFPLPVAHILYQPAELFAGGARDEALFQVKMDRGLGKWIFYWDFGDESKAKGAVVNHVFEQPGTYVVTLTLLDGSGVAKQPYSFSQEVVVRAHRD
ncbi:MAG: PKD domain-containing protein, partial [Candidatus Electrothrix sp. AR3]|nr:PKD domain-containing protein [Candidatus Electrothrix sp. AR3]